MKNPNVLKAFLLCFVASVVASAVLSTCMVATHRTGRLGAVIDNLGGIKANASGLDLNAKKAFNAGAPTVGTDLTTKTYVDTAVSGATSAIANVRLMTASALPAGTYSNGAGTYTVTANGACAAIDGVTPALNDVIANQNATDASNGIYTITQIGSGGTPCIFTRDTNFDTAAELQGASFRVKEGTIHGGGTYAYPPAATHPLTIGTSIFFANRANPTGIEGFNCTDELTMVTTPTLNVSWIGPCGFEPVSNTIAVATVANGSNGILGGAFSFLDANTATAYGGLGASTNAPAGSGYMFNLDTNIRSEFKARAYAVSLSNGTNRYSINVGFSSVPAASQVVPANGMVFNYDDATSANWRFCCSTASTPVCTDTGVAVGALTMVTFQGVHEAGAPNAFGSVNGSAPVSVAWSACPAGTLVEPGVISANSAGTSNANRGTVVDSFTLSGFYPLLR